MSGYRYDLCLIRDPWVAGSDYAFGGTVPDCSIVAVR